MLPRVTDMEASEVTTSTGNPNILVLLPNVELESADVVPNEFTITAAIGDTDVTADLDFQDASLDTNTASDTYGCILVPFTPVTQTASEQVVSVTVDWRNSTFEKSFTVPSA
jgi:hypothetical protein